MNWIIEVTILFQVVLTFSTVLPISISGFGVGAIVGEGAFSPPFTGGLFGGWLGLVKPMVGGR